MITDLIRCGFRRQNTRKCPRGLVQFYRPISRCTAICRKVCRFITIIASTGARNIGKALVQSLFPQSPGATARAGIFALTVSLSRVLSRYQQSAFGAIKKRSGCSRRATRKCSTDYNRSAFCAAVMSSILWRAMSLSRKSVRFAISIRILERMSDFYGR